MRERQCEQCEKMIPATEAHKERYPGVDGHVTLYFCPDCTEEKRGMSYE